MNFWNQVQEQWPVEDVSCSDNMMRMGNPLSALLELDCFLEKVLGAMDADGLRICRYVCRRWNRASKRLPIRVGWVTARMLPQVTAEFTNVVSVAVDMNDAVDCEEDVFSYLSQIRSLRYLALVRCMPWQLRSPLPPYCSLLHQLQVLDIVVTQVDVDTWLSAAMRCLAKLTSLKIQVLEGVGNDMQPFTEVCNLQELNLTSTLLVNRSGQLLFPSLTSLRHLAIMKSSNPLYLSNVNLKDLMPYKASLQQLDVDLDALEFAPRDWSKLKYFKKLESVSMPASTNLDVHFFDALEAVSTPTELHGRLVDGLHAAVPNVNFEFTGSKHIAISVPTMFLVNDYPWCHFPKLKHLKSLTSDNVDVGTCLCYLKGLEKLDIRMTEATHIDVPETLRHLTSLKELTLTSVPASNELSNALYNLKDLRSLCLWLSTEDTAGSIQALAYLQDLTSLSFSYTGELPCAPTLSEINGLRNLRQLEIGFETVESPCDYLLEGYLNHLEHLVLHFGEFSEDDYTELRQRFPCLGTIHYNALDRSRPMDLDDSEE